MDLLLGAQTLIEYAIIFSLGFFTAALITLMLAPSIHGQIVAYTEKRLHATLPISPKEVRAQKDMLRAQFAVENAKTQHELRMERERSISLRVSDDTKTTLTEEKIREAQQLSDQNETLANEMAALQQNLSAEKEAHNALKLTLDDAIKTTAEQKQEILSLKKRINIIQSNFDEHKVTLYSRDIELEQHKLRVSHLLQESTNTAKDYENLSQSSRETALALTRESRKNSQLENKIADITAQLADQEQKLSKLNRSSSKSERKLAKLSNEQIITQLTTEIQNIKTATKPNDEDLAANTSSDA